jgi:hypothetical protein
VKTSPAFLTGGFSLTKKAVFSPTRVRIKRPSPPREWGICFLTTYFIHGGSFIFPIAILSGKTTTRFPACHWKMVPTAPSFGSVLGTT